MPNKTQRFSIDLERNEAVAKVAADVEPGTKLEATLSVVSKDDKTMVVELEEIEDPNGSADDEVPEADETSDDPISTALRSD